MTSSHIFKTLLVCSVSVCMAAACNDANIQAHQPGCTQGQPHQQTSHRNHALRAPTKLVPSLLRDPWFDDLWNDPFDWGQGFPLLSFSSSPCGSGLSIVSPSSLVRKWNDDIPSPRQLERQRCQQNLPKEELNHWAAEEEQLYIKEANLRNERENLERRKLEADNKRKEQQRKEAIQNEQYQRADERQLEHEQRLHQQQVDRLQRLKEQKAQNLRRQIEERRLQEEKLREQRRQEAELQKQREEKRRLQQRQEAEELQRRRKEEQRWKEERLRQEQEAYEKRIRQQQEQRQAQEEQLATERRQQKMRQRQSHQGTNPHNRYHQRNNFKKTEIANLQIPGYWPEDVSALMTSENRLIIQGKHICSCHEKCTEREFQRSVPILRNVDPLSLEVTLSTDGKLIISGTHQNMAGRVTEDLVVAVQSDGSFTPTSRNLDSSCGGTRTGFKLKKMNKQTGEILEDFEDYKEMDYRTFEDEIDEDGVTMEVMDF